MSEHSRIKFNPVTQEIEIEGSEKFVKIYFDKIQAMFSGKKEIVAKEPIKKKSAKAIKEIPAKEKITKEKPIKEKWIKIKRKSPKAPKVAKVEKRVRETKRSDTSNAVLSLIQGSPEGITTKDLEEKTGLKDKQVWAIVYKAKKMGKIKQVKRGVYVGA